MKYVTFCLIITNKPATLRLVNFKAWAENEFAVTIKISYGIMQCNCWQTDVKVGLDAELIVHQEKNGVLSFCELEKTYLGTYLGCLEDVAWER